MLFVSGAIVYLLLYIECLHSIFWFSAAYICLCCDISYYRVVAIVLFVLITLDVFHKLRSLSTQLYDNHTKWLDSIRTSYHYK